ncbi:MAG: hypothetical protein IIT56_11310, partial [Bacteroidales bacterium]|nr:hypothetical protein [Bacteroidales bacterium]
MESTGNLYTIITSMVLRLEIKTSAKHSLCIFLRPCLIKFLSAVAAGASVVIVQDTFTGIVIGIITGNVRTIRTIAVVTSPVAVVRLIIFVFFVIIIFVIIIVFIVIRIY